MAKKLWIALLISFIYVLPAYAGDLAGPHMLPDAASNASEGIGDNREAVYHSVFTPVNESADSEEICAQQGNIVKQTEVMLRGRDCILTAEDIDWSKTFKSYLPTPELFGEDPELEKFYTEADYIWVVPMYADGMTLEITFNKIGELDEDANTYMTDDQIARWKASVGKWKVIGGRLFDETINYKEDIARTLEANGISRDCHSFMLSGLFGISMPLVVVVEDEKPKYVFPAMEMHKKLFAEKTNARERADCASTFIYSFDEVKEASNDYLENYVSKEGVLGFSDIEHLDIEPIDMGAGA